MYDEVLSALKFFLSDIIIYKKFQLSEEFLKIMYCYRMIKMWDTIVSYVPEWKVFIQAFIVLFIPYIISRFFSWIRALEKE